MRPNHKTRRINAQLMRTTRRMGEDFGKLDRILDRLNRSRTLKSAFDPTGLPELALAQWPDRPELADAFKRCTHQWVESDKYTYLVFPYTPEPLAIAEMLRMDCPVRGGLFVDVLKDGRIGGIEFLDKLFGEPTSAHALFGAGDDLLDEAA